MIRAACSLPSAHLWGIFTHLLPLQALSLLDVHSEDGPAGFDRPLEGILRDVDANRCPLKLIRHRAGIVDDESLAMAHRERHVPTLERLAITLAQNVKDVGLEPFCIPLY